MRKMNLFVFVRLFIGGIYLFSGLEKLLEPQANFIYVIQGYQLLNNPFLERFTASVFPWLELILGAFLILGLWTRLALIGVAATSSCFIFVVGQAIVRHLAINECGCFGEWIKIPLPFIVGLDSILLALVIVLSRRLSKTSVLSLDQWFLPEK